MSKKWRNRVKITLAATLMGGLLLSGCGSKDLTPQQALEKAMEQQNSVTDMDSTGTMKMTMDMAGQSMSFDVDMDLKISNAGKEDMAMAMKAGMNMMGQDVVVNTYYQDGCYYVDSMGEKMKQEMDIQEALETVNQNSALTEIPMDAYTDLQMTTENGSRVISYTADGSKLGEWMDELFGSVLGGSMGGTDMDLTIKSLSGTMTLNDDFMVTHETMKADMSMTIEGQDVSYSMDMDMTMNNPGETVTVELPDDLDTYEAMDLEGAAE